MFCWGRGWTPHDELYGIVDQLINPSFGLYEPIGIPEPSTFNFKKTYVDQNWAFISIVWSNFSSSTYELLLEEKCALQGGLMGAGKNEWNFVMIFLHLDCASSERIPLGIRIFSKGEDWNESVNFIICMIIMGVTASQENLEEV